jgi:aspartyl protease family protein
MTRSEVPLVRPVPRAAVVVCFLLALVIALPSYAVDTVQVLALTRDRVILSIDGQRRVIRVGETSEEGVRLIEASSAHAVVEIDGRQQRLEPGSVTTPIGVGAPGTGDEQGKVVLWADSRGSFHADGSINGRAVRFLVDTGATTIALSERAASEIGLSTGTGRRGVAQTAGGVVGMTEVTLDQVSVGSITLYNVTAGVVDGDFPAVPLLGATFLNHVDMQRAGQRMELQRK